MAVSKQAMSQRRQYLVYALSFLAVALSPLGQVAHATEALHRNGTNGDAANRNVIVVVDGIARPAGEVFELQCVPFARALSRVNIFGDAHTWWDQAAGRYARGNRPELGAVMSFKAHGSMRLGHVAAVSRIIDRRTVLLSHSNWSPINGRRGQIERNVRAIDVSPGNDWSAVRVWYAPTRAMGANSYPLNGFIYARSPGARGNGDGNRSPDRQPRLDEDFLRDLNRNSRDPIGDLIGRLD